MKQGIVAGVLAYTLWGVLPVYWKAVQAVPPLEILCHRTVWSLAFVVLVLSVRKQWGWLAQARTRRRTLLISLASALLLSLNWFIYIWAVNSGHVVDSSLGYFVAPLVNVSLGVLFLRERPRAWQSVAIGCALLGVVLLTVGYGAFPWIAVSLALSFGFYGLLRKISPLGSLEGLSLETGVLSLLAVAYLVWLEATGSGFFGHGEARTTLLLAGTGIVTALPLLLFAYAARQVTLGTVGIMQYISPTFQFLLGVLAYGEPFTPARLLGFLPIWLALIIYSVDGLRAERRRRTERVSLATAE